MKMTFCLVKNRVFFFKLSDAFRRLLHIYLSVVRSSPAHSLTPTSTSPSILLPGSYDRLSKLKCVYLCVIEAGIEESKTKS